MLRIAEVLIEERSIPRQRQVEVELRQVARYSLRVALGRIIRQQKLLAIELAPVVGEHPHFGGEKDQITAEVQLIEDPRAVGLLQETFGELEGARFRIGRGPAGADN